MALDQEQRQKIANTLQGKGFQTICKACNAQGLEIVDKVILPALDGDTIKMGAGIPTVVLACPNCGHLTHFSAMALGV